MSNFKDTSWVPQQHQQLQVVLSTLNYCVTCANVLMVDLLLVICNQGEGIGLVQKPQGQWRVMGRNCGILLEVENIGRKIKINGAQQGHQLQELSP